MNDFSALNFHKISKICFLELATLRQQHSLASFKFLIKLDFSKMAFLLITRQKDDDKKYFSLFFRLWPLKYFHTERPSASIWLSQHISWSKHTHKRNFYVKANLATFHCPKVCFEERALMERVSVLWNASWK